jgi:hypothetical protein
LPGGDGSKGVAERKGLDADGAGKGNQGLVDGQLVGTTLRLMVLWIDLKGRLSSEI